MPDGRQGQYESLRKDSEDPATGTLLMGSLVQLSGLVPYMYVCGRVCTCMYVVIRPTWYPGE
jgi:hypothetical protein